MECPLNSSIVKEKKFRVVAAVILSVFVIVVVVLCATLLRSGDDDSNSADDNSTDVPSPFAKTLIVQIGNSDLWALDLNTNNRTFLIKDWHERIHSFDLYLRKTIYVGSSDFGKSIESSSREYAKLSQPTNWVADKIAVDYIDDKVYVLDVSASNINIFDIKGSHYNIVMSHLRGSKDIALDPIKRLIFVLQSSSIVVANIDGSSRRTIVDTTALSSFAIDNHDRIYYADLENINSVKYKGQEHKIATKISNEVISMAAIDDKLFWLYRPYESKNAILYSCEVTNGICASVTKIPFDGRLLQVKAYNFDEIEMWNPCDDRQHGCEHMCVMNSTASYRCVCSIGWQLDTDSKNCKPADDFLLYVEGNYVKSQILDNDSSGSYIEAILPFKLNASLSTECYFDFDVRNRLFVYGDGRTMRQMHMIYDGIQIEIEPSENVDMIVPAIDWISDNMYYISGKQMSKVIVANGSQNTSYQSFIANYHIKVHSMKSAQSVESLVDNDKTIQGAHYMHLITSLVVHPNKGILFYVTADDQISVLVDIRKMYLDGGSSFVFEQASVNRYRNALAIDCPDDRLYWFDSNRSAIYFTDMEGVDVASIDIKSIKYPIMMSIYKSWLFVSTSRSVWRLDKITGENPTKILPQLQEESQTIFGAKIFSRHTQPIDISHPCAINNGDCQRYCFAIPSTVVTANIRKVCSCGDNEKLNPDGKTCYKKY